MGFGQWLGKTFKACLRAAGQRLDYKVAGWGGLALVFVLFGDALLPVLSHLLHMLFALVETALGHVLMHAFDLSHRQAQFVVAYSGLALAVYAAVRLLRRAQAAARQAWQAVRPVDMKAAALHVWRRREWRTREWRTIALSFSAVGVALFLFT
ncbi:MAG: hypothetical protein ACKN9T_18665 [Candidatus Methylumidiphilus sp.]